MVSNSNDFNPSQSQASDMYNLDPIGILRRKFWTILFFVICSTELAMLYYFKAPKTYESWARVYIDDRRAPTMSVDGETAEDTTIEKYLEIITSHSVLAEAIEACDIENMKSFEEGEDELYFVRKNLIATPSDTKSASGVMRLRFQSGVEEDCQIILANVLDSFGNFIKQGSKDTGTDMVSTMTQLEKERAESFREVMAQINTLMQKPFIQVTDGKVYNQYEGQGAKHQEDLDINASDRLRFTALRDNLIRAQQSGANIEDMVIDTIQDMNEGQLGGYNATQQKYVDLKVREQEMMGEFGGDHPELQSVRDQIVMVDNMRKDQLLSALRTNSNVAKSGNFYTIVMSYLDNKISLSKSHEESLKKAILEAKMKSLSISKDCEKLTMLLSERELMLDNNFKTNDKLQEDGVLGSFDWQDVRVIDPASEAEQVAPSLPISLAGGLLLGALFGFIFGALKEMAERTFRSSDDVSRQLGVSVVAQIGKFNPRLPRDSEFQSIAGDIVTLHRPQTQSAESFKALRTSIFFRAKQEANMKVIQVTSPSPGDGKSVVSSNLAVVMAQSGRRILLIDCDLRRQTQHLRFGVGNSIGVTSILAGSATLDEATQETAIQNLDILAAGPPCGNPAEILTAGDFGKLIEATRAKYDFVIVDTPPVLPVTDPVIITSHVDAVYMPMRIRKGVQVKSMKAIEALALVGRQVDGVIINGLSRKEAGSYGYGGYGYGTYGSYGAAYGGGVNRAASIPTLGGATNGNGNGSTNGNGSSNGNGSANGNGHSRGRRISSNS